MGRLVGACVTFVVGGLVRGALRVYFRRIERFHTERVPRTGPVLFASNHPGSVSDALIIGALLPRRVHFLGTVQLFQFRPVAWLLRQFGVIPINRKQDNPQAMHTVARSFEACFRVLEEGGAVGIFPEGITYSDARLRPIRTGAARLALDLEDRHDGRLGLVVVPVGLTYSAKDRYRSDVLVHFGPPIVVAEYVAAHRDEGRIGVTSLSAAIEQRLRSLIVDLPSLEHARVVQSISRLYLDTLRLGNLIVTEPMPRQAERLVLEQAMQAALVHFEQAAPERLAAFLADLNRYERQLARLRLPEAAIRNLALRGATRRSLARAAFLVAAAPVAFYGWIHRWLPARLVAWAVDRFTHGETRVAQTAHASMIAGLVAFALAYGAYVAAAWIWFGAWPAFWYALSLPPTGLVSYYYGRVWRRSSGEVRTAAILLRAPLMRRRLLGRRLRLIRQLEAFRREYREVLGLSPEGRA